VDILERVCAAYAWQRALGHATARKSLCSLVWDRAHPDVWDANHVSEVRARTAAEIEQVLRWADEALGHCRHRLVIVDPLTPAAVTARLALDDYRELAPTIQLVLDGPLRAEPRAIELRAVTTDEDWQKLAELVRHDHTEAGRTQTHAMPPEVTRGIVAGYRKKAPTYQFFLAHVDGVDCAYGAGVLVPNRIGMVEDLFTLPGFRKRGIATALIARAIAHVRQQGADQILIGALATAEPKRLYARLGFDPVCITRQYIKHLSEARPVSGRGVTSRVPGGDRARRAASRPPG
jgi:GNAT superfamily N-acetyltransferase